MPHLRHDPRPPPTRVSLLIRNNPGWVTRPCAETTTSAGAAVTSAGGAAPSVGGAFSSACGARLSAGFVAPLSILPAGLMTVAGLASEESTRPSPRANHNPSAPAATSTTTTTNALTARGLSDERDSKSTNCVSCPGIGWVNAVTRCRSVSSPLAPMVLAENCGVLSL